MSTATSSLGALDRRRLMFGLVLLLVVAAGLRARHFEESRINGEHQYQSAMLARHHFFSGNEAVPAWRKEVLDASLSRQRVLEAPVLPYVASVGYRLVGRESLAIQRLMAALSWFAGGLFLYLLARRLAAIEGALLAAAYFLLVPSGTLLSVSMLPDATMIMLLAASLYLAVRHFEQPAAWSYVAVVAVAGAAILVKPVCVFPLAGAIAALTLGQARAPGGLRRLVGPAMLLGSAVALGGAFYVARIALGDDVAVQAETSFAPDLILTGRFWRGWINAAVWATGPAVLIASLFGVAMARGKTYRSLLLGLWGGYLAYCLVFTYHIRFAGHYHLFLVPIVALSLAPLAPRLFGLLTELTRSRLGTALVAGAVLISVAILSSQTRRVFDLRRHESPQVAAEIGTHVAHGTQTVYVSPYYGTQLEYFGELSGRLLPPRVRPEPEDPAEALSRRLAQLDFEPEQFIITDFERMTRMERDVWSFLRESCRQVAATWDYEIYALDGCVGPVEVVASHPARATPVATRVAHAPPRPARGSAAR